LSGYGTGLGSSSHMGGGSGPPDFMATVRTYTDKIEDYLTTFEEPIKPYVPAIGRFLIVATFVEDAIRILTQWSEQLLYLREYRHMPTGLNHIFLLVNIITMSVASVYVIARRKTMYASIALAAVVVIQAIGYGLIFDISFFLRNLSVIGGLLLVLSDSWVRSTSGGAGLPKLNETDKKMYIQLFGRILLILLFVGFVFSGEFGFWRALVSIVGAIASIMVVVGFKAKYSATLLVIILSIFNVFVNNFWTLHEHHPQKDFAKYDFFQTLSIVGGLVLLVNMGPGNLSIDEKKKIY